MRSSMGALALAGSLAVTLTATVAGPALTGGPAPARAAAATPAAAPVASGPAGLDTAALAHDGHSDLYRVPFGTVSPGQPVRLRLRTAHDGATSVSLRLAEPGTRTDAHGQPTTTYRRVAMTRVAQNVSCYGGPARRCDFWQTTVTAHRLGVIAYHFLVRRGPARAYYVDQTAHFGGLGRTSATETADDYRIHVVRRDFPVNAALANGVMYQIFPDRFANGDRHNDPATTAPRYDYPAPPGADDQQRAAAAAAQIQHRDWSSLPEGYCRDYVAPAQPCTQAALGRDYFGGDLAGVLGKLDYLRHLGVTILYLNPIFGSASDHGYDVRDFYHVDPAFGGDAALGRLIHAAHRRGMKIILDGPFDPTSSDSPFFDRYHHYSVSGACESPRSPYRAWFTFHDQPAGVDGPCAGTQAGRRATYDSWGGVADALPLLTKRDPAHPARPYAPVARYFYGGRDSVAQHWLDRGVDGWRLDSMQDASFPAAYWQQFRRAVKHDHPDAPLIAEAWHSEDNLPLTNGDTADTPMGYRFRAAVLSLLGATGHDKGFPGEDDPNVPVSQFVAAMQSIQQDYAPATYRTFMNLLDSHDTPRLRWMLTPGQNNREDKENNAANVAIGRAKEDIATTIQFTVPGLPSVYYGDEVGVTGSDDPDNRRAFPWRSGHCAATVEDCAGGDQQRLRATTALAALRAHHPVFRDGQVHFLLAGDTEHTLAYALRGTRDVALVLVNRDEQHTRRLTVPTGTVLRDGVRLREAAPGGGHTVATAGGALRMTLPPLTARVLLAEPGQDLTAPAAPTGLRARSTGDGRIRLRWTGSAGRYVISRSPLSGGYQTVASTSARSYVDTDAAAGTRYHYVVQAIDPAGNRSARSAPAQALAQRPVRAAVLTGPGRVDHAVTADYTTVTATVVAPGVTDPGALHAQVGLRGPDGWHWRPMTGGAGLRFTGTVRAPHPGRFRYTARFSLDDHHWVWARNPGVLIARRSADTTAPAAPSGLRLDWSASALTLHWSLVADVAEYRILRDGHPLATVSGSVSSYVDDDVSPGEVHRYRLRALDAHLNASAASAAVSHRVEVKQVQVTFEVTVPASTPAGQSVYLAGATAGLPAGAADPLCAWCGGTDGTRLHHTTGQQWQLTLSIPDGSAIQYKYTRGGWDTVETTAANRSAVVAGTAGGDRQTIRDTVPAWQDQVAGAAATTPGLARPGGRRPS